jgi:hypothetical protein
LLRFSSYTLKLSYIVLSRLSLEASNNAVHIPARVSAGINSSVSYTIFSDLDNYTSFSFRNIFSNSLSGFISLSVKYVSSYFFKRLEKAC